MNNYYLSNSGVAFIGCPPHWRESLPVIAAFDAERQAANPGCPYLSPRIPMMATKPMLTPIFCPRTNAHIGFAPIVILN